MPELAEASAPRPREFRGGSEANSGAAQMCAQVRGSAIRGDCRAATRSHGSYGVFKSYRRLLSSAARAGFWGRGARWRYE